MASLQSNPTKLGTPLQFSSSATSDLQQIHTVLASSQCLAQSALASTQMKVVEIARSPREVGQRHSVMLGVCVLELIQLSIVTNSGVEATAAALGWACWHNTRDQGGTVSRQRQQSQRLASTQLLMWRQRRLCRLRLCRCLRCRLRLCRCLGHHLRLRQTPLDPL